jgi:mannosyltransferase
MLLTLGVCLWDIEARQVWRDEHSTWWAASLPPRALIHLLSQLDAVIAPYYLLMRGVLSVFGDSPLALRLPSALAMAASAGLLALLGQRLFDARVGLYAGLLFALLPSITRYGQEARPYGFVLLAVVCSALALLHARDKPSAARLALYAASLIALGSLHLVALCSLVAHPVLLIVRDAETGKLRLCAPLRFTVAVVAALLTLSPLAYWGSRQVAQISWTNASDNSLWVLPRMLFVSPGVGRSVLLLALAALWKREQNRVFAATWALLPLAFLYLTRSHIHLFIHRYMLFVVPAFCLLSALTLADLEHFLASAFSRAPTLRRRKLAWLAPLSLLALIAYTGRIKQAQLRSGESGGAQFDYLGVATLLERESRASDAIAFAGQGATPDWARMAVAYERRHLPALRDVFVHKSSAELGQFFAEECSEPAQCLPDDVARLWLVTCTDQDDVLSDMDQAKRQVLEREFAITKVQALHNIQVALLERRPSR